MTQTRHEHHCMYLMLSENDLDLDFDLYPPQWHVPGLTSQYICKYQAHPKDICLLCYGDTDNITSVIRLCAYTQHVCDKKVNYCKKNTPSSLNAYLTQPTTSLSILIGATDRVCAHHRVDGALFLAVFTHILY